VALAGLFAPAIAPANAEDAANGLELGGDLRGRYELINYATDATGNERATRGRIRYRFRLDGHAVINPHGTVAFRLVSGDDSRSGNQTLGDPVDFGVNQIAIRRAYLTLTPWSDGRLPGDKGTWSFEFGRVPNPLVWKGHGQDKMLWDNDIALSGASTVFGYDLTDGARVFVNAGYYAIDETKQGPDPYLVAGQVGITGGGDRISAGVRSTFHYFAELDSNFVKRGVDGEGGVTSAGGNIEDGLTGSFLGGELEVVEAQAFVAGRLGAVPVVAFGGYCRNLSAEPSRLYPDVGEEDSAYNLGIEFGDKKRWALLGFAWFHIEANAFPSQFIDSDFLDGHTNRRGLLVYFSRRILTATDFNVQAYDSDAIATGPAGLEDSVKDADRFRLQVDLVYGF
jgi:hypothetical protein